ncbi:hypothetical protein GDO78_013752 [Eleutherodactylus coqui]|uniref:Uncharacterized protein n=1 Tax=Eleutherodactylus coqui TaxID=57060 RepID=A0A8J6BHA4_ELECQ|nr:hypothetical protein GDO78_013752 [Eleutherodactylus coqui]
MGRLLSPSRWFITTDLLLAGKESPPRSSGTSPPPHRRRIQQDVWYCFRKRRARRHEGVRGRPEPLQLRGKPERRARESG